MQCPQPDDQPRHGVFLRGGLPAGWPDHQRIGANLPTRHVVHQSRETWEDTQVRVLEDGFEHQGERFTSLSPIARRITGTAWSGPKFFGLRLDRGKDRPA
ncbi:DUF2924 domain-containing protein [Azospirillum brasilense]|nr:DUF2924 domain-containing protein [Azospirillum argentinense]